MAQDVTRQLSIFINDREVTNSLSGISKEMSKVRGQLRNLNKGSEDYEERSTELKDSLAKLTDQQRDFREELYETNLTAQEAGDVFSNLFVGLSTGNFKMVQEGINGLKGSIISMTKASLAFVATPVGAIIAAITVAAASAKAIFDYNDGLTEMNEQLRALGVEAENISKVRSEIEATAETFDKDFDELASKANSLAKAYEISMSEANAIIAQGLADGGAKNAEFLDSIGEYDQLFANAGYSATSFINLVNTGFELGIYTDKLPDAIKEADLALRENTTAARDALVNAFGASFSDEILNQVNKGEITTAQALERLAAQAEKTNLTQQQQAQLTADIFKGAGEDAGGALAIFEAVGASASRELDKTAQAQLDLVDANERLNKAQAELFEIEGFADIWTNIKVVAVDAFASMLEYIVQAKEDFQPLLDLVGPAFSKAWGLFKNGVQIAFLAVKSVTSVLPNLIQTVVNTVLAAYNTVLSFIQKFVALNSSVLSLLGVDVDAITAKLEALKKTQIDITTKTVTENEDTTTINQGGAGGATLEEIKRLEAEKLKAKEAADKARAKADAKAKKEQFERDLALAKAQETLAKAELENFVANNTSKIDSSKALTQVIIDEENARLKRILDAQLAAIEEEKLRDLEEAERKAKSDEELQLLKEAIELESLTQSQELQLAFQVQTDELKKQYEEEQKALKAEQLLLDDELAREEAETDLQQKVIEEQQRYAEEKARYKKLLDDKKITDAEYNRFVEIASAKTAETQKQLEIDKVESTLNALSGVSTALTDMFGQTKELAVAQALINGALSVTSILSAPPIGPAPIDYAIKAILIAGSVATVAKNITSINKQKAPKAPKFFYGGATGNVAALGNDEYGPITGYVHKNEYVIPEVMTQDPAYANTIGWLEANRQQKLKGYVNGGSSGEVAIPSTTETQQSNADLAAAVNTLNTILASGIKAYALIGYEEAEAIDDLNTETANSNANGTLNDTTN